MFTKLLKEFPRAFAISLSIFFSIVLFNYLLGLTITFDVSLAINFGYSMLYGLSLYYANALVFIYLDSLYKETRFSVQRLIVGFVSTFFITLFVIFLLRIFEEVIIEKQSFTDYTESEKASSFLIPVVIFFDCFIIYSRFLLL